LTILILSVNYGRNCFVKSTPGGQAEGRGRGSRPDLHGRQLRRILDPLETRVVDDGAGWTQTSDLFYQSVSARVATVLLAQHKKGKIYRITITYRYILNGQKYSKWPQNRPNSHKIYQNLPIEDSPKLPKVGFLVSKYDIWQPWFPL
jgi:hypothetical protein